MAEKSEQNIFAEARIRLDEIERIYEQKCDWQDPEDVAFYKHERRLNERIEVLSKIAPSRVCPGCGEFRASHRSWVISLDGKKALCRSCFSRAVYKSTTGLQIASQAVVCRKEIFPVRELRYCIDPFYLCQIREELGISRKEFATRCGWHVSYQRKLESGIIKTVGLDNAEVLLQAIQELGGETQDLL